MDDFVIRPRYPRHSVQNRRRRKSAREESTLAETILRQALIAVVLLIVVVAVKSINTPVTGFLTEKVKEIITQDIELKAVYQSIDDWLKKIKNNNLLSQEGEGFDQEALPAGAGFEKTKDAELDGPGVDGLTSKDTGEEAVNKNDVIQTISRKYKFAVPVEGVLSSPFGERTDPMTQELKMHNGIDIEADKGSSIKAALGGTVIESGSSRTYGYFIKIDHRDGLTTVYAHCSELIAKKGQEVKQGSIIAKVGDTGASVGSHLHFEIWKDGTALDPLNFIDVPSN